MAWPFPLPGLTCNERGSQGEFPTISVDAAGWKLAQLSCEEPSKEFVSIYIRSLTRQKRSADCARCAFWIPQKVEDPEL